MRQVSKLNQVRKALSACGCRGRGFIEIIWLSGFTRGWRCDCPVGRFDSVLHAHGVANNA